MYVGQSAGRGNVPLMMNDLDPPVSHDNDDTDTVPNAETDADPHQITSAFSVAESENGATASSTDDALRHEVAVVTTEITTERQPSMSEYLVAMLNSESAPGLLPRFASWSLVTLGDFASYQHSKGLFNAFVDLV